MALRRHSFNYKGQKVEVTFYSEMNGGTEGGTEDWIDYWLDNVRYSIKEEGRADGDNKNLRSLMLRQKGASATEEIVIEDIKSRGLIKENEEPIKEEIKLNKYPITKHTYKDGIEVTNEPEYTVDQLIKAMNALGIKEIYKTKTLLTINYDKED